MHANAIGDGHILTQYAEKYFGEYLSNDEINEICYNGDDKVFCENVRGEWILRKFMPLPKLVLAIKKTQ